MGKIIIIITLVVGVLGLFIEPINALITSEIASKLLIPAFLIYFTFIFATKGIEKFRHDNTKELKIDDYYQEVSKEVLINLIKDWTDLYQQTNLKMYMMAEGAKKEMPNPLIRKNDQDKETVKMLDGNEYEKVLPDVYAIGKLIMTTWIYGKSYTNKLLAGYQQHNYKDRRKYDDDEQKMYNTKSIAYMTLIIISLRNDLMNIESEPLELIKLKVTDISVPENKERIEEMIKEIKEEVDE